jgi:hypothetical protein
MMREVSLGLLFAVGAVAGGLDSSGPTLPDLGAAPRPAPARWYDAYQAPAELAGRPWVLWCGGVRPDDLPEGRPPPADVLQLLEELRRVAPTGDLETVALFDELEEFVGRPGKRHSALEVQILGGSYIVGAAQDARTGGRSCREELNQRFGAWPELREGDGIYGVVDRRGRFRLVGTLDPSPRARRRITRGRLEAAVRAVAGMP